jgi:hypothetical protein
LDCWVSMYINALGCEHLRVTTSRFTEDNVKKNFQLSILYPRRADKLPNRATMKEALVLPDLSVNIIESPIPTPGPDEIIIQVVTLGINPMDWKGANPDVARALLGGLKAKQHANPGKDFAGYVYSLGSYLSTFR